MGLSPKSKNEIDTKQEDNLTGFELLDEVEIISSLEQTDSQDIFLQTFSTLSRLAYKDAKMTLSLVSDICFFIDTICFSKNMLIYDICDI